MWIHHHDKPNGNFTLWQTSRTASSLSYRKFSSFKSRCTTWQQIVPRLVAIMYKEKNMEKHWKIPWPDVFYMFVYMFFYMKRKCHENWEWTILFGQISLLEVHVPNNIRGVNSDMIGTWPQKKDMLDHPSELPRGVWAIFCFLTIWAGKSQERYWDNLR